MTKKQVALKFSKLFAKALTDKQGDKTKTVKEQEADYYELTRYINGLTRKEHLEACLNEYLRIYTDFSPQDRRSCFIFALLLTKLIDKSKVNDKSLEALNHTLTDNQRPFPPLRQRFEDLEEKERRQILALLKQRAERKKESESIIDELKQAYFNSYPEKASFDDLAAFDPFPDKTLADEYEELTAKCNKSWWASASRKTFTEENVKTFRADFAAFTKFLATSKKEDLKLFQILKWSREKVLGRREVGKGVTTTYGGSRHYLDYEFYLQTVFALLLRAIQIKHLKRNYAGFTSAEDDFFFSPITGASYYSNYENRFKFAVKDVEMFSRLTDVYLRLILYAESRYLELLSDRDALKIQKTLDVASQDPARKRKLKETVFSTEGFTTLEVAKGSYKIGDKVGVQARFTIIYFQPLFRDGYAPIYVEFDEIPGFLFKMTISQFTDRIEAIPRLLVWEKTKSLLRLIPLVFEVIGYLPTVISGGFAALIREIVEDIVIEKVTEAVSSTWERQVEVVVCHLVERDLMWVRTLGK